MFTHTVVEVVHIYIHWRVTYVCMYHAYTYKHAHTHMFRYMYVCLYMCVYCWTAFEGRERESERENRV